jgi:hypothetical protein
MERRFEFIPSDPEYHSRVIITHRVIHALSLSTITGLFVGSLTNSQGAMILGVVAGEVVSEFLLGPYVWSKLRDIPFKK